MKRYSLLFILIGLVLMYPLLIDFGQKHLPSSLLEMLSSFKFYPVCMNLFMLLIFGFSLRFPPPIIERLARLKEPNLSPAGIIYTRRVTQVWCLFFIVNGSIALATTLWATPKIWSLYNGVISYLLMGLLWGLEYLYRQHYKRRHHVQAIS